MNIVKLDKYRDRHEYLEVISALQGLITKVVDVTNAGKCEWNVVGEVYLQLPQIHKFVTPTNREKYEAHEFCMWGKGFSTYKCVAMKIFMDSSNGSLTEVTCEVVDQVVPRHDARIKLPTEVRYGLINPPRITLVTDGDTMGEVYKKNGYSLEAALYMLVEVVYRTYLLDLLTIQSIAIKQINTGNPIPGLPKSPLLFCKKPQQPLIVIEHVVTAISKLVYAHCTATSERPKVCGITLTGNFYDEFPIKKFLEGLWSGEAVPTDIKYWWLSDNASDNEIKFLGVHSQRYAEKLNGISPVLLFRHLRKLITGDTEDDGSKVRSKHFGIIYNAILATLDTLFDGPFALCAHPSYFFALPIKVILEAAFDQSYRKSGDKIVVRHQVYPLLSDSVSKMLFDAEGHYLPYEGSYNESALFCRYMGMVVDQFVPLEKIVPNIKSGSNAFGSRLAMVASEEHIFGRVLFGDFVYLEKTAWLDGSGGREDMVCAPDVVVLKDYVQDLSITIPQDQSDYEASNVYVDRHFARPGINFPKGFDINKLTYTRDDGEGGALRLKKPEESLAYCIYDMLVDFCMEVAPASSVDEGEKILTFKDALNAYVKGLDDKFADGDEIHTASNLIMDVLIPILLLLPNARGIGNTELACMDCNISNIYPAVDDMSVDRMTGQFECGGHLQLSGRLIHDGFDESFVIDGVPQQSYRTAYRPIVPLGATGVFTFGSAG